MSSSDRLDGRGADDHAARQARLFAEPLDDVRSRRRSSRDSILRDTPMWSTVGM